MNYTLKICKMQLKKKTLTIIISFFLVFIITIPSLVFILFYYKTDSPNHPSNMGVEEWLEDFDSFYNFIEKNYPYIWLKERTHNYNWLDLKPMMQCKPSKIDTPKLNTLL